MRQWIVGIAILSFTLATLWGVAQAQYRTSPRKGERTAQAGEEEFDRAVDLKRFRRGNFEWDTQELIASGFKALHRDHQRILERLQELEKRVERLEQR